jgi:hypothetical protein
MDHHSMLRKTKELNIILDYNMTKGTVDSICGRHLTARVLKMTSIVLLLSLITNTGINAQI